MNFAVDPVVTTFNPAPVTFDWDASVSRSFEVWAPAKKSQSPLHCQCAGRTQKQEAFVQLEADLLEWQRIRKPKQPIPSSFFLKIQAFINFASLAAVLAIHFFSTECRRPLRCRRYGRFKTDRAASRIEVGDDRRCFGRRGLGHEGKKC